jgi:hypothetical protein
VVDLTNGLERLKKGRYFSLSYDIPKTLDDLANLIRSKIRRYALAVHESGYLVPSENVLDIRDIIKTATVAVNEKRRAEGDVTVAEPKIRVLLIDENELPEILDWAKERAEEIVKEIAKSFEERLARVVPGVEKAIEDKKVDLNEKSKEIASRKKAILRELKKRAEDADSAFFWFASTNDAKSALKGVIGLIEAERNALKEVAQIGETPLKQEPLPTK